MVDFESYISRIRPFVNTDLVKIVTDSKNIGKVEILNLIRDEIIESGVSSNQIIEMNFRDKKYEHLLGSIKLHNEIIKEVERIDGKVYLFFDEIQMVKDWERCVNSFRVSFDSDVYVGISDRDWG